MLDWTQKHAWRVDSNRLGAEDETICEQLAFEYLELQNKNTIHLGFDEFMQIKDLKGRALWVTKFKQDVRYYIGDADYLKNVPRDEWPPTEKIKTPKGTKIIAEDGCAGYYILLPEEVDNG